MEEVARVPMWEVLRNYPATVLLGWGARLIDGIAFTVYAISPQSYLTTVAKIQSFLPVERRQDGLIVCGEFM